MKLTHRNAPRSPSARTLPDPPFEVSTVALCPSDSSYRLGSYDGGIVTASIDLDSSQVEYKSPLLASESLEAVNAIAFDNDWMAISTRADITIIHPQETGKDPLDRKVERLYYGSHDLVPCSGHGFLASRGIAGLLRIETNHQDDRAVAFREMGLKDLPVYYYRTIAIPTENGSCFVSAVRKHGVAVISPSWNEGQGRGRLLGCDSTDIVDVRLLNSAEFPSAVVALGRDGSLYFSNDILQEPMFRRAGAMGGSETAYKLCVYGEHLLVHTDRHLTLLPTLGRTFLERGLGEPAGQIPCERIEIPAVDVFAFSDRLFFISTDNSALGFFMWNDLFTSTIRQCVDILKMENTESKIPPREMASFNVAC